jgi:thiol-disulfide isomerase/thioredoxin
MIIGPEVAAYNWAHAKISDLWHHMVDTNSVPPEKLAHMVDYYAAGCPHCKHLEPTWKDAAALWAKQGGEDANGVVWEQKQCLDENWKPGADFKECQAQHVARFPTIRFFSPGAKTGEDYFLDREPKQLVDFVQTGIHPGPNIMPRAPDDGSDLKLVDFYAAACPHCKDLEPVWEDAHKQWDKAIGQSEDVPRADLPLVSFEKKECYDSHWNPGKDIAECRKFHVDAFPSIKLFVPDPHGHGFAGMDYEGDRTSDAIVNFLGQGTGLLTESPQDVQDVHDLHLQDVQDVQHVHDLQAAASAQDVHDVHQEPELIAAKAPDAVETFTAGEHVPEAIKAAAAASHAQGARPGELTALQGNTPGLPGGATVADGPDLDTLATGRDLPQAIAESVRTAMVPLPILTCMPIRRNLRQQKVHARAAPPAMTSQFI